MTADVQGGAGAGLRPEEGLVVDMKRAKTSEELANDRTALAVARTAMAASRTLMGWVRTGLSMISFGFAVYKFLAAAIQAEGVPLTAARPYGPRRLGLALIALGTITVILGTVEYFAQVRRMNRVSPTEYRPMNFTLAVGMAVGFLGLFLFVTILANIELF